MSRRPQDARWRAVAARDAEADGQFVYAVLSTGVYCRPSCPSRRPRPDRVSFFGTPQEAEHAGFRACRRCRPRDTASPLALKVDRARQWIDTHPDATPTLARLARVAGTSPWHLQRTFKRLLGVTPKEYASARRAGRTRSALRSRPVLDASYEAGFGSPARLYAEAPATLGMTPGQYRRGGSGQQIRYATADSSVGALLVAVTTRGVCRVDLGADASELERRLRGEFPDADLYADEAGLKAVVEAVRQCLAGRPARLSLDLQATVFQRRVWQALQQIPAGETRTYGEVARGIGEPGAARAVARACATNPVALLVPCHRVVPSTGGSGGYRWGVERKTKILEAERRAARAGRPSVDEQGSKKAG